MGARSHGGSGSPQIFRDVGKGGIGDDELTKSLILVCSPCRPVVYSSRCDVPGHARFRAFDAKTGKEVWTFKLPAAAEATPMTYEGRDGKQYVAITSTGGGFFGNPVDSDSLMAFALK